MKILSAFIVNTAFLIAGCAQIPIEAAVRLADARRQFAAIQQGMTKQEVISRLGTPQRGDGARRAYWEVSAGMRNRESLTVEFDDADKVLSRTIVRREANRPPVPET